MAAWLERVVPAQAVRASAPLLPQLASGTVLAQLLAVVAPERAAGLAALASRPGPSRTGQGGVGDFRARDRVALFLRACDGVVRRSALFEVGPRPHALTRTRLVRGARGGAVADRPGRTAMR